MAQEKLAGSVMQYLQTVNSPPFLVGLAGLPATPWYLGQPDASAKLLPGFYRLGVAPELEREILREYKANIAEFTPLKGASDADVMLSAHTAGVPSRLIDWAGSSLAALFMAVESLAEEKHGRVWVLNPWSMNEFCSGLSYVPMTDTPYLKPYVPDLANPEAGGLPEAQAPMAFRTYHSNRAANAIGLHYTVHGRSSVPLDELKFFMKKADFLRSVIIDGEKKKAIMKELHGMGITRANLYPGISSMVRTLVYRYSKEYLDISPS